MASARIHRTKLPAPPELSIRKTGEWWPRAILRGFVLLPIACLLLPALWWWYMSFGRDILPYSTHRLVALCVLVACVLWHQHLLVEGMGHVCSLLFAGLLAGGCALSVQNSHYTLPVWLHAFGCGLFVYAIQWAFNLYEREGGLQAIASVALVLSLGLFATPAVLILCVLLCLILFFKERQFAGGITNLLLLLFTPLLLCFFSLVVLSFLYGGGTAGLWWIPVRPASMVHLQISSSLHDLWPVIFGLAMLVGRVIVGKAGMPDLVYLSVAIVLPDLRLVPWIPDQPSLLDLSVMLICGAACLLATAPPLKVRERFLFLAGLTAATGCSLWG